MNESSTGDEDHVPAETSARMRHGPFVLRAERWGGLALDERHDRVWGFSAPYFETFHRAVSGDAQVTHTHSDAAFEQFLQEWTSGAGAANPYRNASQYFFGEVPASEDFVLSAPVSVSWSVTNDCQSACLYCCTDSHPGAHGGLASNEVLRIIDSIAEWGALRLIIGGGEPTLRPDLDRILSHAQARGLRPTLATNGLSLERFDLELYRQTVMLVQVSLDSLVSEVYSRIRGFRGDGVKTVLHSLRALLGAGIPVRVVTVLSRSNEAELESIGECLAEMGVDQWFVFLVQPAGRGKLHFDRYEPLHIETVRPRLAALGARLPHISVSYWGADTDDRVAVYVDSHGRLQLFDYGTGQGHVLERLSECSPDEAKAAWASISGASQHSTLVNFTTNARRPSQDATR